jgi:kynurenine 3-monooxygenase
VLADAIPMRGRMMHGVSGELAFQPYSKDPREAINSVSRSGLNLALLEAADRHDTVTLHFDHPCLDVDLERAAVTFAHGDDTVTAEADLVVGADGAFSVVRGRLQRTDRFDYQQMYLAHGYKELTIPPDASGGFAMEPHALHIWPRGGSMMIALPNPDRTFTCTCFWPFTGPGGFDRLSTADEILADFRARFGDAVPLMPTLVEDFQGNPTSSLVTVRCRPWHHADRVVLIGDAAHAIVPFYGQGMNAAFEDCVVLDECLAGNGADRRAALEAYTRRRKPNGDAIADLALRNFVEMRDKVGSRLFRLGKRTEKLLHRWFPRWFTPLYNMVTFSTIPYAEARRRSARQWRAIALMTAVALVALAAVAVTGVTLLV